MIFGLNVSHLKEELKLWEPLLQHCKDFSRPDKNDLAAGTVQETVAKLGEVFRANMGYNPPHGVESQSFHPALL
jgi:hypothetical protein